MHLPALIHQTNNFESQQVEILDVSVQWWVEEACNDFQTEVFAATAGLGAGKTHGLAQWHHDRVLVNWDCPFSAFCEPTYKLIFDTAIPTYRLVLTQLGLLEDVHYKVFKTPHPKLVYAHGHEVHFVSVDRPKLLVGVQYSHASVDEAGECKPEVPRNLRSRVRHSLATCLQTMFTGAPQGINWFADMFDSDTLEGWDRSVERDHTHPRGYRRFRLITDDNPFLPASYINTLEDAYGHNPNLIKSYRYGIFSPLFDGAAFKTFREDKHVVDIKPDKYRDIYLTFDFNAMPLCWVAAQVVSDPMRYAAVDESGDDNEVLDEAIQDFVDKFPPSEYRNTPIHIYGDRSGHASSHKMRGSDYDYIRKELRPMYKNVQVKAQRGVIRESESVEAVNRTFAKNKAIIAPKCRGLIKGLQGMAWKPGERKLLKPSGETISHKPDGWKYLVYELELKQRLSGERVRGVNR